MEEQLPELVPFLADAKVEAFLYVSPHLVNLCSQVRQMAVNALAEYSGSMEAHVSMCMSCCNRNGRKDGIESLLSPTGCPTRYRRRGRSETLSRRHTG